MFWVMIQEEKRWRKTFSLLGGFLIICGAIVSFTDHMKNTDRKHKPYGIYEAYFKRFFDFAGGLLAVLVFWPVYLTIAVLVRVKLGPPVLFQQERPGKDEKIFRLYKFRTMTEERDAEGSYLADEARLTPFGCWLRRTSLDEIPEIFNIIKGDMSFVGPRPLLVKYLPRYNEEQRRRHEVRPGLTGYAQVSGRNAISWQEKFRLDLEYVNKITFPGDVRILVKTLEKAWIRKDGIHSETSVTMEEFMGNEK